jgi:hypothetical protein
MWSILYCSANQSSASMKARLLSVMISSSIPQWQKIPLNMNVLIVLLFSFRSFWCSRYDDSKQQAWMM